MQQKNQGIPKVSSKGKFIINKSEKYFLGQLLF